MNKEPHETLEKSPDTSQEPPISNAHLDVLAEGKESSKHRSDLRTHRLWLIELWFENRELFKEFVKHVILFSLLLSSLECLHRLLMLSSLAPQELNLLGKLHFFMSATILLIFATGFIIRVLRSEFRRENK